MIPILVTGGAGYIGSHACKLLAKSGFLPIVYDNLSTGHREFVKWGPLVVGDIQDRETLRAAIRKYQPVAVLHFAADALVIESMQNPAKYYRNNLAGTLSLLETMREEGVKNIIFSSTCATYGMPRETPINETHPQAPISPYGRTKWMVEQMMLDFDAAYGMKSIFLRYFNAAGADLDAEIGERHDPETHLVPIVIQTALNQRDQITVYGDGSAIRDYIHVDDLAEAHLLALRYLLAEQKSDCFNLGTGAGTSISEIIAAVQQHTPLPLPIHYAPSRPGEPTKLTADFSKAEKTLGWRPKQSIPTIIASAWNWHQL
jgi:UDP-arabinose 4-epimerase